MPVLQCGNAYAGICSTLLLQGFYGQEPSLDKRTKDIASMILSWKGTSGMMSVSGNITRYKFITAIPVIYPRSSKLDELNVEALKLLGFKEAIRSDCPKDGPHPDTIAVLVYGNVNEVWAACNDYMNKKKTADKDLKDAKQEAKT